MAPVSSRHFFQSSSRRDHRSRDRVHRDDRYDKTRKRRSRSRSEPRHRDDSSRTTKKSRPNETEHDYDDLIKQETDPEKKFRLILKKRNAVIKRTLSKSVRRFVR